jgi:hypothetical protein
MAAAPMMGGGGGVERPNPNQNMKRDRDYYTAIMQGNKTIKDSVKELRMGRVDDGLALLKKALEMLGPYSTI